MPREKAGQAIRYKSSLRSGLFAAILHAKYIQDLGFIPTFKMTYFQNILNHKTMGLLREPKGVDFTGQSTPWNEKELLDFRKLMEVLKSKKQNQDFKIL